MTIIDAIAAADALRPNQYETREKIAWLSALDGQVYNELIATHEGAPDTGFAPYGEDTPHTQALLIPEPYAADIYCAYLHSCIDRSNGEIARYNQSSALFNASYLSYQSYYNRTHMPLAAAKSFTF